jgi:hypothetical protein
LCASSLADTSSAHNTAVETAQSAQPAQPEQRMDTLAPDTPPEKLPPVASPAPRAAVAPAAETADAPRATRAPSPPPAVTSSPAATPSLPPPADTACASDIPAQDASRLLDERPRSDATHSGKPACCGEKQHAVPDAALVASVQAAEQADAASSQSPAADPERAGAAGIESMTLLVVAPCEAGEEGMMPQGAELALTFPLDASADVCATYGHNARVCVLTDAVRAANERGEGVETAPLREVLLGKAALPGFGVIPSGWVPEVVRRCTLLHHMLCTAATPEAVIRLLQHTAGRGTGSTPTSGDATDHGVAETAYNRLAELLSTSASCPPKDALAAHKAIDATLRAATRPTRAALRALVALGALARCGIPNDELVLPVKMAAALLPRVLAAAATPEALRALRARSGAVEWLQRQQHECVKRGEPSSQAAMSLSANGGAAVAIAVARAELELAAAGGLDACDGRTVADAFQLLVSCTRAPDGHAAAVAACGGLPALMGTLIDAIHAYNALDAARRSAQNDDSWMLSNALDATAMVLRTQTSAPPHAPDVLAAALTAMAASRMPEAAAEALAGTNATVYQLHVSASLWEAVAEEADAWPGGGAALLARIDSTGVVAALAAAVATLRHRRDNTTRSVALARAEVAAAEKAVRAVRERACAGAPTGAAERAADALLAEEAQKAEENERKAAARKASADAKRAAAAAEKAAAAEQAAAAATAAAAAQEAEAAEKAARRAERRAAARAAAAAQAEAAEAAAEARRQQAAQAAARREERRAAAAQAAAAAAAQQAQLQQASGSQSAPHPVSPPQPPSPQPAAPPSPHQERASDALIGELFPWMRMHDAAPSGHTAAAPQAPLNAAAAAGGAGGDDGDDGCCVICMDAERNAALVPCDHALLCVSCAAKVLTTPARACPMCRATATGIRMITHV